MAIFVMWSMCTMTMPAFVNDGCNLLLMMVVTITKIFFSNGFNMLTDCWSIKIVLHLTVDW
jgi:hypothetical protein